VFGDVDNKSVIAQEEIFGPVLSVIPAADEADALRIANDTIYGLHSAVFTPDVERARRVAGQLRTGTIGPAIIRHPLGGAARDRGAPRPRRSARGGHGPRDMPVTTPVVPLNTPAVPLS
jgi:Aldehyde dehydrogenase family